MNKWICILSLLLLAGCRSYLDVRDSKISTVDSIIVGRVIRYEGYTPIATLKDSKKLQEIQGLRARNCAEGLLGNRPFRINPDTGFFAIRLPLQSETDIPLADLNMHCLAASGGAVTEGLAPIVNLPARKIEAGSGTIYILHARKIRFNDWIEVHSVETAVDESGELNNGILTEFQREYPEFKDSTNIKYIK